MAKKWVLPPDKPDEVGRLMTALRVSEVTARLLVNRGLSEPGAAQKFLQPSLRDLVDPCHHPAAGAAARFLLDAARSGKRITVYGDYDADGICAASVLLRCFEHLGAGADLYIPHRVDEGYGLSCDAVRELAEGGTQVLVTVDCGISAAEEVALANRLGMDIVVTDHHPPQGEPPPAAHVLNPKLDGGGLGYPFLAGVGVAFKLMWAIGQQLAGGEKVPDDFRELMVEAMALVALGTVADVVPLLDENRALVHFGLRTLGASSRPGLQALMAASRVNIGRVSARDVAYRLAPRLNAAGRMGDARAAVELLITPDPAHAMELAQHLEQQNRLRRSEQQSACAEAEEMLWASEQLDRRRCIVLNGPGWHQGILGLVASRMAEKFWRPAFVFAENGDVMRGSARSVPGFPLNVMLEECADLLERYGGHAAAAGLSLPAGNLDAFTERINALAERTLGEGAPTPELALDGEVTLEELSPALVHEIEVLSPFGQGNPRPAFAAGGLVQVGNPTIVGSTGNHLTFLVRQGEATLRVIAMGRAEWIDDLRERKGEALSLAFEPIINTYRGRTSVELRAEDMQWDAERLVERREA